MIDINAFIHGSVHAKWKSCPMVNQRVVCVNTPLWVSDKSIEELITMTRIISKKNKENENDE